MYQAVIFDVDGTLWDSRGLVAEGYNVQLKEEGLEHLFVTVDDLTPLFGKVMTDLADALFGVIPEKERYELMERCMATENRYLEENPCHIGYPKVKETIAQLSKKHRIFIVTNAQKGYAEVCIEKLGLGDYVSGWLSFGDTGTSKGKTIRTLMAKHGIENAVYIGDSDTDILTARNAGMDCISVTWGFRDEDFLRDHGAVVIAHTPDELLRLILTEK